MAKTIGDITLDTNHVTNSQVPLSRPVSSGTISRMLIVIAKSHKLIFWEKFGKLKETS